MNLHTLLLSASLSSATLFRASTPGSSAPTYTKNVAKVLNGHCVECHRPGEVAPMAFTNNKYNPDPAKEVKWGDQTWEEMTIGWFTYTVPAQTARLN
jgi:hypothetical protein